MDHQEKEPVAEAGGEEGGLPNALEEPKLSIQQVLALQHRIALEQQASHGAGWFGTIAWLSLLNTALIMGSAGVTFVGALDILLLVNVLADYLGGGPLLWGIALALNLMGAGVFLFLQKKAQERRRWAYWTGLVLFGLDAIVGYRLTPVAWLSAIFHGLGLLAIWKGLQAAQTIEAIEEAARAEREAEPILLSPLP